MERSPHFDEGYHGDTTSQPESDTGAMTPNPLSSSHAGLKTANLQLSFKERYRMAFAPVHSIEIALTRA